MKPYDGGGWQGVSRLEDEGRLRASYEESGTHLMHLQRAVEPWDRFVRCIALGRRRAWCATTRRSRSMTATRWSGNS